MESSQQQAPYYVRMDSEDALKLVKQGASLLLLDVPASTSFGIDQQMFVVGPNFKGVKMMPPGPHFIYYSAASRHGGDTSPITGFFLHVSSSEVIVKIWDPEQERVVNLPDENEGEGEELESPVKELSGLIPEAGTEVVQEGEDPEFKKGDPVRLKGLQEGEEDKVVALGKVQNVAGASLHGKTIIAGTVFVEVLKSLDDSYSLFAPVDLDDPPVTLVGQAVGHFVLWHTVLMDIDLSFSQAV